MSDSTAADMDIRERRRMKILARSEERLKKLTANTWNDSDPQTATERVAENIPATCFTHEQTSHANGVTPVDTFTDTISDGIPADVPLPPATELQRENASEMPTRTRLETKEPLCRPPIHSVTPEPVRDSTTVTESHTVTPVEVNSNEVQRFNRFVLLLALGFVVRLSFIFSFGQNYVQSIFNPFIATEIAVFGYEKAVGMEWREDISGFTSTVWLYAFGLLGLKPTIIASYRRVLANVSVVLEDFAACFFTFVLAHLCLQLCSVQ